MSLAMDPASKAAARPIWIGLLLALCLADLGCAGMRPTYREPPRSGGLARIRRIRMQNPLRRGDRSLGAAPSDLSAPAVASAAPEPRTVVRSTAPPPGAILPPLRRPVPPVAVALQPPPAAEEDSPPVAATTPGPSPSASAGRDAEPEGAVAVAAAPKETPKPPADPTSPAAGDGLDEIAALVASARTRLDTIATYQVRLTRQERVGEVLQPAEDVLLSVRRRPKAVRLEWPDGPHKGREVLYSATGHGGLMHIKLAESLVPIPPLALAPDSPLALRTSRHPITEAGFDTILENIETALKSSRAGDPTAGLLSDGGAETPEAIGRPCRKVLRKTPAGETWTVYLDAETQLPASVQALAADGALLEMYLFRDLRTEVPELASAAAFDPDQRFGRAAGLLNRLARAAASDPKATADAPSP